MTLNIPVFSCWDRKTSNFTAIIIPMEKNCIEIEATYKSNTSKYNRNLIMMNAE